MSNPYITESPNGSNNDIPNENNNNQKSKESDLAKQDSLGDRNKSSQKNGNGFILGLILGIILTIIGTKFYIESKSETTPVATPPVEQKKSSTQAITVTEVTLTPINTSLQATGTVAAFELIPVMSQANNLQITQVLADEGDFVTAGQVLAKLDDSVLRAELVQAQASVAQAEARVAELQAGSRPEELQRAKENINFAEAEVRQAQSDLDLAKKKLDRNRMLAAEGAIARDRLDELINQQQLKTYALNKAKARVREAKQQLIELQKGTRYEVITQAQASLSEARARVKLVMARLKDTQVIAPASGKIAERNARVGDVTSSFNSQNMFTIIEDGRLELQAKIPETQLNQVDVAQSVKITSDTNSKLVLTGKVREIDPTIDQESRQATVNVDLPPSVSLKPGMFLKAEIIASTRNTLTIPMNAVLPKTDGEGTVYVVQPDNTVKSQLITMGELLPNEKVEIKTGLNQGDIVAVKGAAYLKDGDKVTVNN